MEQMQPQIMKKHYRMLGVTTILSFICMYILMYSMVDRFENVTINMNEFYMAAVMAAPMPVIMILLMRSMYTDKKLNALILLTSFAVLGIFFFFIRAQTGIGDKQFMKSMIPHHAGAILMVNGAELKDTSVQRLAKEIIISQQREIDFMKKKLEEIDK